MLLVGLVLINLFLLRHLGGQHVLGALLLLAEHVRAGVSVVTRVDLHEFGDIKLRLLQDLHLADVHVLEGEHSVALLGNVLLNGGGDEFLHVLLEGGLAALFQDGVDHALPDLPDLRRLGVTVRLALSLAGLGEADAEHTDGVSVRRLHIDVALNEGLPLAHEEAELVTGEGESVEVHKTISALDILDGELDLLEALVLILTGGLTVKVEITQVDLGHTALKTGGGDLGTLGLAHQRLAAPTLLKHARGLQVVPFLFEERVTRLLFGTLFTPTG